MSGKPWGDGVLEQLRRQILANPLTELEVDEVARRFEVSRGFALKAINRLTKEGLLERAQVYRVPRAGGQVGAQP